MINRLLPFLRVFLPFLIIYLFSQLYFQLQVGSKLEPLEHLSGIYFGMLFSFKIAFIPLLIGVLLGAKNQKIIMWFTAIYFAIVLFIHFALQGYLLQTGILLGADLFGYTLDEITHTIQSSGNSGFSFFIVSVVMLAIFGWLIYFIRNRSINSVGAYSILGICVLSWIIPGSPTKAMANETARSFVTNPSNYFWSKSFGYVLGTSSNSSISELAEFPFLHNINKENPLDQWLDKSESLPNIVIIAVEGLGADFVGAKAQYGGFTPYLDSLLTQSIYFENALSNTGRTFGILPILLGSLPYSQSGFMSRGVSMPDHFTLFSWLKTNGYHTSFFYGGNSNFDGQDIFLERQQTDYIMDESKFPSRYTKMKSNNEGFSWGYGDLDLFDFSMEKIASFPKKPRISFYMTITTHEPFLAPDDRFTQLVNNQIDQMTGAKKSVYKEYQGVFECLRYTDDALKQFISAYQEREDFKNTIFIITGDHRLIPVPAENRLSRFHIPLIIYSPLIKKAVISEQVVAHSQVVPTIASYLSQSYSLPISGQVAFISDPLPTDLSFGSQLDIALMRNKNEIEEYVSGTNVLSNGEVYEIGPNFSLGSSVASKEELVGKLNQFVSKSTVALNKNRLLPKDLVAMEAIKYFDLSDVEMQFLNDRKLLKTAPDTLFFEARSLAFAKDYEKSRIILKYGLSKSPNYHDMRVLLARTFAWDGQYDSAYRYLNETLKRAEKYEDAYTAYVDVLYWDDKEDELLIMLENGLKDYPKSPDLKARMARYYLSKNEINKASILVNEVLKIDNRNELANALKKRIPNQ